MTDNTEKKYVVRIYYLFALILTLFEFIGSYFTTTTIQAIRLCALLLIFYYVIRLQISKRLVWPSGRARVLLILLIPISVWAIARGAWPPITSKGFYLHLLSSTFVSFLLPYLILPLPNKKYLYTILDCFFCISILSIPLWIINPGPLVQEKYYGESIAVYLPFLSATLLGFLRIFSKKKQLLIIGIWLFYFLLMLLNARRNVSLSLALYALIAFGFNYWKVIKRNSGSILIMALLAIIVGLFISLFWVNLTTGTFKNMSDRASEDTRSGVEALFFLDFTNSPIEDWIFGRGIDGGYYQEMRDEETGEINTNRTGIETGYLNLLLRGGLTYAFVIIYLLIIAVRKGIKSKESGVIYLTIILSTYFIDQYTTSPVSIFNIRSVLYWFLISVCLSNSKIESTIDK